MSLRSTAVLNWPGSGRSRKLLCLCLILDSYANAKNGNVLVVALSTQVPHWYFVWKSRPPFQAQETAPKTLPKKQHFLYHVPGSEYLLKFKQIRAPGLLECARRQGQETVNMGRTRISIHME
jgi:hypothetical protein